MKLITTSLFLLVFVTAYAQTPASNLNEKQKQYFQTIVALSKSLKSTATKIVSLHNEGHLAPEEAFYDTVINRYFNKEKLLQSLEADNGSPFSQEGKLDFIRHLLYACDSYLDKVSLDNIIIERGATSERMMAKDEHILDIYSDENDQKKLLLKCKFDPDTNKLIGLVSMLQ